MDPIKLQRLAHKLYLKGFPRWGGVIQMLIYRKHNCDIAYKARIGAGTVLGHRGIGVVIHPKAVIGKNCVIAQNVTIAGKDGGAPVIGDNVYIGHGSIVMGNIHIGNNCFIGALSLVNKTFPDNCVIVGAPGRFLKIRSPEELQAYNKWRNRQ